MDSIIFGLFAIAYVIVLFWGLRTNSRWTLSSLIFLVVAVLIYDNAIYALGTFIGEGTFLKTLINSLLHQRLQRFFGSSWFKSA
jgi:hypothetical protein